MNVVFQVIASRLSEQQKEYEEQRTKLEKQEQEFKAKLQSETAKVMELQMKLHELNALSIEDFHNLGRIDDSTEVRFKLIIYCNVKEEISNFLRYSPTLFI